VDTVLQLLRAARRLALERNLAVSFTLMELVVAIVVTGVVAAIGYGAFATLIDRRAELRTAAEPSARPSCAKRWRTGSPMA